ncbi:MAG: VWA domain-containing protein [Xanthomonadales bacterium]|nr:VWA domain-containing protein [Xanthomonadales bacterium]
MFIGLFERLRSSGVPVSLRELLDLHAALEHGLAFANFEELHALARALLVKDERHFDRFDRAFGQWLTSQEAIGEGLRAEVPPEWLRLTFQRELSEREKALIESLGGLDALLQAFRERLAEQKERHSGGNRWIGTGGSSPFGAHGYHPEGIRLGSQSAGHRRGVKVWEQRSFRDLDDSVELNTRSIKLALRRLRRFAREGAATELDLDGTLSGTARKAGLLDIQLRPERHNAVKVLLLLDIGGSMDEHVRVCEELFSAARSEFKHIEHYYFHNCVYESVWRSNTRRRSERTATQDLIQRLPSDWRLVLVGDAAMAPYEITHTHGSVEHDNAEPGAAWLQRLFAHFRRAIWINPLPRPAWDYTVSVGLVRQLIEQRMYPMSLRGLDEAIRTLSR